MEQQQTTQQQGFGLSNFNYVNNSSFMNMRLDTSSLVTDIERFLHSIVEEYAEKDGKIITIPVRVGRPLANKEGIMRICNIVRMRINHHLAQGNMKEEHYWEFIGRARKEITETIVKKCYDWEIDDNNLNMIIDEINALIEGFMTRPIDNKERDSYNQQFVSREQIVQNEKSGGLMGFSQGIGKS